MDIELWLRHRALTLTLRESVCACVSREINNLFIGNKMLLLARRKTNMEITGRLDGSLLCAHGVVEPVPLSPDALGLLAVCRVSFASRPQEALPNAN